MGRRTVRFSGVLLAAALQLLSVPGGGAAQDSTSLSIRVGPGFDAHSDLLASPFRLHGIGLDGDITLLHNAFEVTLGGGMDRAGTPYRTSTGGFEDLWTASVDVRWARRVASLGAHTSVELGADVGGLIYGRRYQYGEGYRSYFDDVLFPLSVTAGLGHDLGHHALLEERVDVGVLTVLLRSPFAGARRLAAAWWTGPTGVQVFRHRLRLSVKTSPGVRLFLTHGLTFVGTDRVRPLRMVRQDLSVGVSLLRGGGS